MFAGTRSYKEAKWHSRYTDVNAVHTCITMFLKNMIWCVVCIFLLMYTQAMQEPILGAYTEWCSTVLMSYCRSLLLQHMSMCVLCVDVYVTCQCMYACVHIYVTLTLTCCIHAYIYMSHLHSHAVLLHQQHGSKSCVVNVSIHILYTHMHMYAHMLSYCSNNRDCRPQHKT